MKIMYENNEKYENNENGVCVKWEKMNKEKYESINEESEIVSKKWRM